MNSALCDPIEHNIRIMSALRHRERQRRGLQDRVSDAITDFSGSMLFVYLHILWFGFWIVANTGKVGIKPFDPFPYQLLTMVVSLEAILLSTFVLISQNRSATQADKRAELDFHIGLLAEHEITRIIQMLDDIQTRLGIGTQEDPELSELEKHIRPQDVLSEIERVEQRFAEAEKKKASLLVKAIHRKQEAQ